MTTDTPPPSVKISQPENSLKQKVGHGGFNAQAIQKAEQRLIEARSEFPIIARRELHVINASLLALYDPAHLLKEIFAAAVDLKANGGLFAYEVVAAIADSLIYFTETLSTVDAGSLEIIQLHYDALQLVFERGHDILTGTQRDELLEGLRKAVTKQQKQNDETIL